MPDAVTLKEAFILASIQLQITLSKRDSLRSELREVEARASRYETLKKGLEDSVCKYCQGQGKIWVSYAQDDTKLEVCAVCKGTGIPQ